MRQGLSALLRQWSDALGLILCGLWLAVALWHRRRQLFGAATNKRSQHIFFILVALWLSAAAGVAKQRGCWFPQTLAGSSGSSISALLGRDGRLASLHSLLSQWGLPGLAALCFTAQVGYNRARGELHLLQPLLGLLFIPGCIFGLSKDPKHIQWHTVLGGFSLQVLFALFALNFQPGKELLQTFGDLVARFLDFSVAGSSILFGEQLVLDPNKTLFATFAFKILPTIIFFSSFVSVMYYLGVLRVGIFGIAGALRRLIGASTIEAVSSSGNMFLGMTEVPLLLKPLMPLAKKSELHTVMVCGYASVAGSVMAGYVGFGINPDYLILSCFMAAPASVAMSRLAYPASLDELPTTASEAGAATNGEDVDAASIDEALKSSDGSLVEAAGNGASNAIGLVSNIAAMIIAFTSLISFADTIVGWLLECVDLQGWSFSAVMGYAMSPVAFLLGVPVGECRTVGLLLAKKLILNEFLAYESLGGLINNRANMTAWGCVNDRCARGAKLEETVRHLDGFDVLTISARSEVMATFALCGFANLASIGITLGGLTAICPDRRPDFSPLVARTMAVGFCTSLVNACVAGILIG